MPRTKARIAALRVSGGAGLCRRPGGAFAHGIIHQYQAGDMRIAVFMHVGEHIQHAERPAEQHRRLAAELPDQLRYVPPAPERIVAGLGHLAIALAARVEGNDPVYAREILDLPREDPGGHGPARYQYDGGGLGLTLVDVMQPHAVAGDETAVGRACRGTCAQNEKGDQKRDRKPENHGPAHASVCAEVAAPCQHARTPPRRRTSPRMSAS
jgi:hypothetical protein